MPRLIQWPPLPDEEPVPTRTLWGLSLRSLGTYVFFSLMLCVSAFLCVYYLYLLVQESETIWQTLAHGVGVGLWGLYTCLFTQRVLRGPRRRREEAPFATRFEPE